MCLEKCEMKIDESEKSFEILKTGIEKLTFDERHLAVIYELDKLSLKIYFIKKVSPTTKYLKIFNLQQQITPSHHVDV